MKEKIWNKVLKGVLPVVAVAAVGSVFVMIGNKWFNSLKTPEQWLPNFVIPVVWTVIYTIAGVVLFKWIGEDMPKEVAILFGVNGVLNVLWCLMFFTLHLTFVGLVMIIMTLVAGVYLLAEIKKVKPQYFYSLVIYPTWLTLATALNVALWILN